MIAGAEIFARARRRDAQPVLVRVWRPRHLARPHGESFTTFPPFRFHCWSAGSGFTSPSPCCQQPGPQTPRDLSWFGSVEPEPPAPLKCPKAVGIEEVWRHLTLPEIHVVLLFSS